jgi:two-component system, cell cycle sensor histidine kinase and response regulator CckA
MNTPSPEPQPRILIVDDNPAIHEDFRKILGAKTPGQSRLEDAESVLFGPAAAPAERAGFRIDSACQGQEALALVQKALEEKDPYAVAFVDVRMPPGWDGVETLGRIWQCAPELQAVICTAYSDYSWDDMARHLGQTDSLLILKKPFETVEVLQMAHALAQKSVLTRQAKLRMDDLDRMVRQRTDELVSANHNLQREMEERVRIHEALRVSEERFSKAFQCSPIPMAIQRRADQRFLDANQSFFQLSGYTPERLFQHTDGELQLWTKASNSVSIPFSPDGQVRNQACLIRRSDGAIRQTLLSAEPLNLGATPCLLMIVEDVTDQLKLEAQLRQAQKMEVVGRLSAGIAHEFNNLLTVIQGDVGLLLAAKAGTVDKRALLDQIMQASQRAATFTRQLLAFSRKQVLQARPLNLSVVVLRMKKMLSQLIGEKYQIQWDCPPGLPAILADEGGMEQTLLNLVLNARDALPGGGVIQISTGLSVQDEAAAKSSPGARAGRFAWLTVSDRGCGMSPEVLARIFDPFFTTKDIGKGTGLGLPTIQGIVKQHDGWIDVTSQAGSGSTFKIFLPVCNQAAELPTTNGVEIDSASELGKGETVLVVEDESAVRTLACMALRRRGYQVFDAADGDTALDVWNRSSSQVDLLLTDMVMPGAMSGGALAKTLLSSKPQLKVIYTSGYSPEIMNEDSLLAQEVNFLPKPYGLPTLLKAVRLCLDGGKLARCEVRAPQPGETVMA